MLTLEERQAIIAEALAAVNKARVALGGEALTALPPAAIGKSYDCVVHRALNDLRYGGCCVQTKVIKLIHVEAARVNHAWYGVFAEAPMGRDVPLPPEIVEFIERFDAFDIPELIDPNCFLALRPGSDQPDRQARWVAARDWLVRHGKLPADHLAMDEVIGEWVSETLAANQSEPVLVSA